MKNYNKNVISLYLQYLDANTLYGWTMCKKLPVGNFRWAQNLLLYTEKFIKNYYDDSDTGYLLEVDVHHPKTLHELHSDLPFLPERRKKLLITLEDKEKYVIHISALKTSIKSWTKINKSTQSN